MRHWLFALLLISAFGARAQEPAVGARAREPALGARAQESALGARAQESALAAPAQEAEESDEPDDSDSDSAEAESQIVPPATLGPDIRYSSDLSDEELKRRWEEDLPSLGSISVGFADKGRLINSAQMPEDAAWIRSRPDLAWGAQETIEALSTAFRAVHERFPESTPARLSQISARDGGYLRPHRSHQSGRDADVGFFYKTGAVPRAGVPRERLLDPERNWALLRALITETDVQVILVDRRIQQVLKKHAIAAGEDREWIDRLFGKIIKHARRHRDHFHVRFFAPRSQELGRRIQPLLALRPEQNLVLHKVRQGQTLGHIAVTYGTTVRLIRTTNHMRGSFLHLGQQLAVPLRKPCTKCPLPPPVVVPPRCLPAEVPAVATAGVATP
jgi:murein endopeptidase